MTLDAVQIRAWLSKHKKSREWLADQMAVSSAQLNRMLAGKVPKTDTMLTLARIMGRRVEDLIISKGQRTA